MADNPPRLYCNYCQEELKSYSVKCVDCSDAETFDLCLQCFCSGAEIGVHRRHHAYQIMDNSLYPVGGRSEWSVAEESSLLDAIETFGFGNWEGVANQVGSKSKEQCSDHYNTYYVKGKIGQGTLPETRITNVIDHTGPEDGPLSPTLGLTFKPVDLTIAEQQELCYMPLRDDFEREFDNDAETLISNLAVTAEDDDLDISLKLAHVDMYSKRLVERGRRKGIARENGLISAAVSAVASLPPPPSSNQKQKAQALKRKVTKEELEFREKLKPFLRFIPSTDLEEMFDNIQKEKEIKSKIKELVRCRRNGINKLKECSEYEEEKAKREKRKESKRKLAEKTKKGNIIAAKKPEVKDIKDETKEEKMDIVDDDYPTLRSSHGFNYLSEREKKLCSSMKMKPARYVTLKTLIIKDHYLRKRGIPPKTRYPSNLDKSHRKRIANFLTRNGWIKAS